MAKHPKKRPFSALIPAAPPRAFPRQRYPILCKSPTTYRKMTLEALTHHFSVVRSLECIVATKMPVNRLVQHLLPASHDGSHHLVPKTDDQGQATRTLLGKIFGMTGKRREIINLNGSGVEDPQAQSLLERMAVGDKGDGEVRSLWLFVVY